MRQFIHLGPAFEHEGTIGHEVRINGKPVADLSLTIRESEGKRHAVVEWLGKRGENPMATGPNAFGPKFVRQVLRAVRDTHKITGSITGKRISGFREKRRSEAVNKYGEPLPLPPVVDAPFDKKAAKLSRPEAPRLTLSDPVEATHVEGLGHPEEQAFVHHVRDHTGAPVASMKLVPRGADTLHVAWIGRPPGTLGEDANQLGPSHVREIARIVKRAYPGRTKVTGYRVSGFRAARNNPGSTTAKLSRAGRWLRRAWEATRDTLFDLDEWAESLGRETPTERAAREGAALDRAHRVHAERDAADNKPRASARRERERVDAEVEAQARAERAAKHAAAYKKFADQHHAKFAATFGIDAQRAHKVLTRFAQRAHEEHMRTGATRFEVRGADRTPGSPSEPKLPGGTKTLGLTIRKKSPGPASGTPQGPPRPTKPGGNARPRQFARPSALLKTAPSDLWALLERVHKHHETKLTPDVALNGALADMIDELNGTGHEDPRSTVVRGSGRLDAFGGVYHPALSGAIYHYPHAVQDVVRPFTSGGSEMTLGFTSKGRKASGDEPHIRVPTVQWNVKTPAKVHADKKPRELVFFKPFLTPEGEVDVHGLHEFIDRLPKHARPSWRKAAEENGHPDTREKPVKLMGGFAGGTNTDVPNLVKKPVVKHARQRFAGEGASVAAAGSANHDARLKVAKQILAESGLTPAEVRAAVLHAGGGTRPALAAVISQAAHPDHIKFTAAWLGLATQQPSVAVATVDPAGRDTLHVLHVGGGHEGMTQALKRAGVEKFTVEQGKTGGHRIWVLNPDGKYPVAQLAKVNNARHSSVRVSVTRLGAGSRAAAAGGTAGDAKTRAAYREAIDAFERAGA